MTSHEIDWERTAINFTASSAETESVLLNLEDRFPEGVPVGILTAALHDQGVSISEVLEDLYDLRMNGEIYEPIDDHYRVL
ncbi:MAG: hypothetical protein ABEI27_09850 [Halobellus sp.]|uniref:hypothetical protein n=1 Tax=Halobellus sp. TaxID=1979212 RepID=UPI0035D43367